jgi:AcrR family transcriptional regulator
MNFTSMQTRRTQVERREEAEQRLLAASVALIADRGYSAFALADVAEAAGYSRGLPTHYFGTKDALIAKTAAWIIERFRERLEKKIGDKKGFETLLRFAEHYLKHAEQDEREARALSLMLAEAIINPGLQEFIRDLTRQTVDRLALAIAEAQEAGELAGQQDTRSSAILILGMLRGAVAQWLLDPSPQTMIALQNETPRHLRAVFGVRS